MEDSKDGKGAVVARGESQRRAEQKRGRETHTNGARGGEIDTSESCTLARNGIEAAIVVCANDAGRESSKSKLLRRDEMSKSPTGLALSPEEEAQLSDATSLRRESCRLRKDAFSLILRGKSCRRWRRS